MDSDDLWYILVFLSYLRLLNSNWSWIRINIPWPIKRSRLFNSTSWGLCEGPREELCEGPLRRFPWTHEVPHRDMLPLWELPLWILWCIFAKWMISLSVIIQQWCDEIICLLGLSHCMRRGLLVGRQFRNMLKVVKYIIRKNILLIIVYCINELIHS